MNFSANQLAIAAYVFVFGEDGLITEDEADALVREMFNSPDFYRDAVDFQLAMDFFTEDYNVVMGLFQKKENAWKQFQGPLQALPLDEKCSIVQLVVDAARSEEVLEDATGEWDALKELMGGLQITFSDLDDWKQRKR